MQYYFCQRILDSNIPLSELQSLSGSQPDFLFSLSSTKDNQIHSIQWFHHWRFPNGALWASFAKVDGGYLIRFHEIVDFHISTDGIQIRAYSPQTVPLETIRHLLLDQVMPLVLSQQGNLVFHASAVALPEGAIAFLGSTGLGKSTITASFASLGYPMLTDDCLLLEECDDKIIGVSSYQGIRLWEDSIAALFPIEPILSGVAHYSIKRRVTAENQQIAFCNKPILLRKFYFLSLPEKGATEQGIHITALPRREAYMELFKHAFHLDITDHERLTKEMAVLSRLTTSNFFYRLSYPRDHTLLPAVRAAILAHVKQ